LAINDDLNMPQALAIVQEALKSDLPVITKLTTVLDFDQVLGLDLKEALKVEEAPEAIVALAKARVEAREAKDWQLADKLRTQIAEGGYEIEDVSDGWRLSKK